MASLTQWMWVWVNSRYWWWTGRPGVQRFLGSQRVRHDWVTELNWIELNWYITEKTENTNSKRYMLPNVHSSIIFLQFPRYGNNNQHMNGETNEKKKVVYTHTHNRILLGHKKRNFATCSKMDRLGGDNANWNKPGRERNILYHITYMWNLKRTKTNEYNKKETD